MAKEKKRSEDKKKKKLISVEAEVALLGLLFFTLSLIGLLNQGLLGNIITFALTFLMGGFYIVLLLFGVYIGFFVFFRRKKPKMFFGLKTVGFLVFIVSSMLFASIYENPTIGNSFDIFYSRFEAITPDRFSVDLSNIANVGGGFLGYAGFSLLSLLFSEIGAIIMIVILMVASLYVLLKDLLIKIYKYIKNKKRKEKVKEVKVKEEDMVTIKDVSITKVETKENIPVIELETDNEFVQPSKEVSSLHTRSFNIFSDSLFEDDKIIEPEGLDNKVSSGITLSRSSTKEIAKNSDDEPRLGYLHTSDEDNQEIEESIVANMESSDRFIDKEEMVGLERDERAREDLRFEEKLTQEEYSKPLLDPFIAQQTNRQAYASYTEPESNNKESVSVYDLLDDNQNVDTAYELDLEARSDVEKINQKLTELNIRAQVNNYVIGPSVTRYEIVPETGVRVNTLVNAENDLKLALAAMQTRMEAPIPGKSAVGIEVANKIRSDVYLREVLLPFANSEEKLLVGIGKDLNNNPVVINIDKMPHLLIAGATGSGKSVCINSIIVSLLLRTSPSEVKLLLIDPKRVEMNCYKGLPHLLGPVISDPKQASIGLKRVIDEMDKRYNMFAKVGVRNIQGYNNFAKENNEIELYNIVVIIDELADLMMVASKEVEHSIQRLTQLARAAGIYLIVATQRPSVDVITGVIKANIPSRIAFSVSSSVDSRTILDRSGAERLLGKGDMLMDITGSNGLNRVQGAYVSDFEINKIVEYVKNKYDLEYVDEFINLVEEVIDKKENLIERVNDDDNLYDAARKFVIKEQRASTSLLQRQFKLGYARAGRIIDKLEKEGVVGPQRGSKSREVLISKESEE
ncbi:TPA: DNA translocase FtsK [bacterium]|nr:DNA translocase FtsK [bacterium]